MQARQGKPPSPVDRGFWQRLNRLRGIEESDRQFAARIGIAEQLLNNWKHGRNAPSLAGVQPIAVSTGVAVEWLLTGRGAMYREAVVDPSLEPAQQIADRFALELGRIVARYGLDLARVVDLLTADTVTPADTADYESVSDDESQPRSGSAS